MGSIPERAEGASDGGLPPFAVAGVPSVQLVLASTSPRRRALLEQIGVAIEVRAIDVPEHVEDGEDADAYQARIVEAKLAAAMALPRGGRPVLVADTEVVLDGRVLGKPEDDAHGVRLLEAISGRAHEVRTRFALDAGPAGRHVETVTTFVHVRALGRASIERYVATGEGRDKAGGYAAQGRFAFAITRIDGSYTNVVGLPLAEVAAALERLLGLAM